MLTDRRTDGQCHTMIRAKTSYKYRETIYQSFMQCCLTWPPEQVKVKSTHYKWWQSTCLEWLSDIHSTQRLDKHVFIETQTLWQDSNWEITSDADYQLKISFSKYKDNVKAQLQSKTTFINAFMVTIGRHRHHVALLWRHNEHDGVSNHQSHDCLLNHSFSRR